MEPDVPDSGIEDSIRIELGSRRDAVIVAHPRPVHGFSERDSDIARNESSPVLADAHVCRRGEQRQKADDKYDQLLPHPHVPLLAE